jgi:NAD(P)-dependent dehydrogenase (short-subunit alcohol dehydrogenase family)
MLYPGQEWTWLSFSPPGQVALVTGASRGLGQAFAGALAEAGADLVIVSRHQEELGETAGAVRAHGREVLSIEADIRQEEAVREMVTRTVERFGRLDVLVNNAGTERQNLPRTLPGSWKSSTSASTGSSCAPGRRAGDDPRRAGKIINLASMSGVIVVFPAPTTCQAA